MAGIGISDINTWVKETYVDDKKIHDLQPHGGKTAIFRDVTFVKKEGQTWRVPFLKTPDNLETVKLKGSRADARKFSARDGSLYPERGVWTYGPNDRFDLFDEVIIQRTAYLRSKTNAGTVYPELEFEIDNKIKALKFFASQVFYGVTDDSSPAALRQTGPARELEISAGLIDFSARKPADAVSPWQPIPEASSNFLGSARQAGDLFVGQFEYIEKLAENLSIGSQIIFAIAQAVSKIYRNRWSIGMTRIYCHPENFLPLSASQYMVNGSKLFAPAKAPEIKEGEKPKGDGYSQEFPTFWLVLPYGPVPIFFDFSAPKKFFFVTRHESMKVLHLNEDLVSIKKENGSYLLLDRGGNNELSIGFESYFAFSHNLPGMNAVIQLNSEVFTDDVMQSFPESINEPAEPWFRGKEKNLG